MEIDRNMARNLMEIKRSLPREEQNKFNLSSPDIKKIVLEVQRTTTNGKIKTLAATFLEQVNRSQQTQSRAADQTSSHDKILNSRQPLTDLERTKLGYRKSSANISLSVPVIASNSKNNSEDIELLKTDILPEFLEHINVSELPPLAGSSSSNQGRPLNPNNIFKTSKSAAKSVTQGTAILDKVLIFLTTPIELSMPIKFAKRRPDASN